MTAKDREVICKCLTHELTCIHKKSLWVSRSQGLQQQSLVSQSYVRNSGNAEPISKHQSQLTQHSPGSESKAKGPENKVQGCQERECKPEV